MPIRPKRRATTPRPIPTPRLARAAGPSKTPMIVGYGSVFYSPSDPAGTRYLLARDEQGDILEQIGRNAFDRALAERDDAAGLMNHDVSLIVGRVSAGTLRLSVDATGLRYEIDPPDSPLGESVLEAVRSRSLTGSSFAFEAEDATWTREGGAIVRTIDSVRLYDTGPVTYPAYTAVTSSVLEAGSSRSAPPPAPAGLDYYVATARARQVEYDLELAKASLSATAGRASSSPRTFYDIEAEVARARVAASAFAPQWRSAMSEIRTRERADGERNVLAVIAGDQAALSAQVERQAGLKRLLAARDLAPDKRAGVESILRRKCDEIAASAGILDEVHRRLKR